MSETGQTLAGQIYAKSGADAKSIVLTAEKVAQRDIEQARRRTRTRTNAANAELAAQIASEKALAEATIAAEVTRSQLHARHTLVERLLGDTLRNLAGSARDEAYLAVLTRLVRESVGQLGRKEAAVRCSARDREFLAAEGRFDRMAADVRNAGGAALSLSEKTIGYELSTDGNDWHSIAQLPRTGDYQAAPSLVLVGRGGPGPADALQNDARFTTSSASAWIGEIAIGRVP